MYTLQAPIKELTSVGRSTAKLLQKLGIENVLDLISYFPFRYQDYSQVVKIKDLFPNLEVTVKGKIILIDTRRSFKKRMSITEALLDDGTGSIKVVWFNQPYLAKSLKIGDDVFIAGRVEFDKLGLQFVSPAYEKINGQEIINTAKIVPVYSLTGRLTQKQVRFLINMALKSVKLIPEWLPEQIIKNNSLTPLAEALKKIHFPEDFADLEKARYRLKFNELFLIQLQSHLLKKYLASARAPFLKFREKEIRQFVSNLPFELTNDQKKTAWQILLDLEKHQPMNRLLEGDVGSGKTAVASLAILDTVLNGYQAVLMAPTEILAKQHFKSLSNFFSGFNFKMALLTGSEQLLKSGAETQAKKNVSEDIEKGGINLIIGTHALIQDKVKYKNLGLVIIDEQHRFGVEQRKKIKEKNKSKETPHFLSMTATPIPRSLALILYGDLDLSIIKEMPKGRKKIITKLVEEKNRDKAYDFIREEIKKGRQVFVVCPLIDPSDKLGVKSVKEEFKKLEQDIFPEFKTGFLHGKLKSSEKEKTMAEFKANKIKILVSTSVIEVGIDMPNATIMMIEGAERFGLAQLHQFRGRVGRGEYQSYCFLFTKNGSAKTRERLNALVKSADGFALAEYDLKFRGPGEVYGRRQSGLPDLKIASLNDLDLINLAQKEAFNFLANCVLDNFPLLKAKLEENKIIGHLE
ncbi:MAG TPA: ATP-dependent DNA helicase RecG [Candidatus Uhrbacteria bacterium]|nr:ATP-dependent DNA helicase RecG [Candidatus Uhrbacteria bacterium]